MTAWHRSWSQGREGALKYVHSSVMVQNSSLDGEHSVFGHHVALPVKATVPAQHALWLQTAVTIKPEPSASWRLPPSRSMKTWVTQNPE